MPRRELMLTDYAAEMVLLPLDEQGQKIVEAIRVTVFGPNFPQRALQPELLVGETVALRTTIARNQQSIRGYFLQVPAEGAPIRVRYEDSQEGVLREHFSPHKIRPLKQKCDG